MYQTVLDFWFDELTPDMHWQKSDELDAMISTRFGKWHQKAAQGELSDWRASANGALAEIILLDQFSRNIFRDTASAFAYDAAALILAQVAIDKGFHTELAVERRKFMYLPFMHSESSHVHEEAVRLFTELGDENSLDFEYKHKKIIDEFGRYPHRNAVLGRVSTDKEIAFLKQPNSGF